MKTDNIKLPLPFKSTFVQSHRVSMHADVSSKLIFPQRTTPTCVGSILELIGGSPMVELKRIVRQRGLRGKLFAKQEYLNPGFSQKDRVALEILQSGTELFE